MTPDLPEDLEIFYRRAQARLLGKASEYLPSDTLSTNEQALTREIELYKLALELQQEYWRNHESVWKLALEASGDGILDWDIPNKVILLSQSWKRLLGYSDSDVGATVEEWSNRIHPDDRERVLQCVADHHTGKTPFYYIEYRLRCKDGSYKWVLARALVVDRDNNGNPLRMVGTQTDITIHKNTEEELLTSTRLLETAQKIAKLGSVEIDLASKTIKWSTETYHIHDTTPQYYTPTLEDSLKYYPRKSKLIIEAALDAMLKEGKTFDLELEKFTMKGRRINIRTTCLPITENGKTVRYTGIFQDITEQKTREKALRENEYLLSESQRIARIGSWSWDLMTGEIHWTDGTYRIYGLSPESFTPTRSTFSKFVQATDLPLVYRWCERCIAGEKMDELEFRINHPDGSVRIINGRGYLEISAEGISQRLVGTVQDITERKTAELRLHHQNRVLGMLAQNMPLTSILDTMARDLEYIDPTMMCSILLLDKEGKHLYHGAAPSLPTFFCQAIDGLAIGMGVGSCGTTAFTKERVIVEDISTHPWWDDFRELALSANLYSCWSEPILSTQGQLLGTFAIYHSKPGTPTTANIELIQSKARLAALVIEKVLNDAHLELAASVFSHAREGIMITDALGNIVDINDTFTTITGYTREEAIGQNPRILKSERQNAEFYQHLWRALNEHGFWSGEFWNKHKNGELYALIETISVVRDTAGNPTNYVGLFSDITPIKDHQRQLEFIAHYDALTSLPNRVLLADRLQQAIARCHRINSSLAVLYIDLDGFKAINDSYGHDIGDQLLVAISRRLKLALREGDTLARIGGDEFVVVLVDLEKSEDYESILARLLEAAAEAVVVNQRVMRVSASIGVTIYPQDGADPDQLMRHADQAMYLAKQAGKNCFHLFDVARDVAVKTQRESIENIRTALEQRQFVLYYQPKVNMRTGVVIGAEALVRWRHPERGLVPPAAFLPIIEDHILSVEMGDWVINEALRQMSEWRAEGTDVCVSVNVGALQLQSNNFTHRLAQQLAAHSDVPPSNLELEILETSALENIEDVAELMRLCHALGVHFAVDDFGTGYSSLTYLKRLPAELLKIDQSFVRDMLDDPDDLAIVKGVIGLAEAFHRKVIAEGVETVAHGQVLLQQGCELAQGYGIARPMPAHELLHWIANWRPDDVWSRDKN